MLSLTTETELNHGGVGEKDIVTKKSVVAKKDDKEQIVASETPQWRASAWDVWMDNMDRWIDDTLKRGAAIANEDVESE